MLLLPRGRVHQTEKDSAAWHCFSLSAEAEVFSLLIKRISDSSFTSLTVLTAVSDSFVRKRKTHSPGQAETPRSDIPSRAPISAATDKDRSRILPDSPHPCFCRSV